MQFVEKPCRIRMKCLIIIVIHQRCGCWWNCCPTLCWIQTFSWPKHNQQSVIYSKIIQIEQEVEPPELWQSSELRQMDKLKHSQTCVCLREPGPAQGFFLLTGSCYFQTVTLRKLEIASDLHTVCHKLAPHEEHQHRAWPFPVTQQSLETDWDERDCLASVVISVLTSLYVAFLIYQLLNQQHGVWMVIIINIALGHCSSPFHGFLCILINVTPVGKIPQRYPEYSTFRKPSINLLFLTPFSDIYLVF